MQPQYPPGPRDWFFGLTIGRRSLREPLAFLLDMVRRYGDVVHMHLGPVHTYVINHPNLIREVLVTKGKSFRKWERQKRVFRKIDGDGLINSEGDFWLRQRRLIQKAFHQRRLACNTDIMVELTRRRLDRWTAGAISTRRCHSSPSRSPGRRYSAWTWATRSAG
jgi:cytochrome P450